MKHAHVFRPYIQLEIQIVPNFFGRYQNFSKGNEIYGYRRDFGKFGREKKPWLHAGSLRAVVVIFGVIGV
jgi:hypothetical protein